MAEELPVHEEIDVLKSETVFKTGKWWKAVTLQEAFGRKEAAVYLWRKRGDKWVRKQKFTVKSKENWEKIGPALEEFVKELQ